MLPAPPAIPQPRFLPMHRSELDALGWDGVDILLVSGDAAIDHPSFGTALLGRWLIAQGYRVGVIAQPRWQDKDAALEDISRLGRPRLFAGVNAGALDSMLAHYTAFRKKRHDDAYTPGGAAGARPNRACIAYTGLLRQAFPGLPVVIGGIEASLRRITHYDFWSDALRRSLLLDSKADLLVYGMGEKAMAAIAAAAAALAAGLGTGLATGLAGEPAVGRAPGLATDRAPDLAAYQASSRNQGPGRNQDTDRAPIRAGHQGAERAPRPRSASASCPASGLPSTPDSSAAPGSGLPQLPDAPSSGTPPLLSRRDLVTACRSIPGLGFSLSRTEAEAVMAEAGADGIETILLPSHEAIQADPAALMRATLLLERQVHQGRTTAVQHSGDRAVLLTPPAPALSEAEMDAVYGLPFSRLPHPAYREAIPAWEMIRTSITTHRGCASGCSFCSLALHQGRRIASRSHASVLAEAARIAAGPEPERGKAPRWAGAISDVGGPSANMWQARCDLPEGKACARVSCLHPKPCPCFDLDQSRGVDLLRAVAAVPGVRHVRIASGVRFDLALRDPEAMLAYTSEFTGGQLKVAPEHTEPEVLTLMRKPDIALFERFLERFEAHCRATGKELYTVPYLLSAFPGCTDAHMRSLAAWLAKRGWSPKQVQCFIPTPGTVATAMFYAGIDPQGRAIHVARSDKDRLRQHYLLLEGQGDNRKRGERPAAGTVARRSRQAGPKAQPDRGGRTGLKSDGRSRDVSVRPGQAGPKGRARSVPGKAGGRPR